MSLSIIFVASRNRSVFIATSDNSQHIEGTVLLHIILGKKLFYKVQAWFVLNYV